MPRTDAPYREDIQCRANGCYYDFRTQHGILRVPEFDCTDMGGCVSMFTTIDTNAKKIEVWNEHGVDTVYERKDNAWTAKRTTSWKRPESL